MGQVIPPDGTKYEADDNADGTRTSDDITVLVSEFNGNIDASNLANDAVTTDKIAGAAVNVGKLASLAVRNANIDFSEAADGVKAWQFGPNFPGSFGGIIARVKKEDAAWTGAGPETIVFTFADDCADGNPGFSGIPTLLGGPILTASSSAHNDDSITTHRVTSISISACTIEIGHVGSSTATVTLEFGVAGPV